MLARLLHVFLSPFSLHFCGRYSSTFTLVILIKLGIVYPSPADSRSDRGKAQQLATLVNSKNSAGTDHSRRVRERYPSDQVSAAKRSQETEWVSLERHAIIFFVSMGCVLVNPLGFSNKQYANGQFDYVKKAAVFLSMLSD